ncbi:MAG: hypothetical protein IT381_06175 [Deltaproteobacteria bacterium]|nr:hypothetical protein [Deltaproteobacteria bacterium]
MRLLFVALLICTSAAFAEEPSSQPASQPASPPAEPSAPPKAIEPAPLPHEDRMFNPVIGVDEEGPLPYEGAKETSFRLFVHGYIRARASAAETDAAAPFVGTNNGFNLAHARLELTAGYGNKLWLRFSLDGAFDRGNGFTGAVAQTGAGNVVAAFRDAYIAYQPFQPLRFTIGQFRAPFDEEALTSTAKLLFVSRALPSQGVRATEGFFVPGLSPDRELGLRISGEELHLSERVYVSYFAAITNGNGPNVNANDNNHISIWGRLELQVPFVRFAAAGMFNPITYGTYPNLFDEQKWGVTGDVRFEWNGLEFLGQFMFVQTKYTSTGAPTVNAMGAHGQVGYKLFFGLQPAYRIAWLEPNDRISGDQLLYHTFGLNYELPWVPIKVFVNYSLTGEQSARSIKNNLFECLVQAVF